MIMIIIMETFILFNTNFTLTPEFIVVAQTDLSTSQAQSPLKICGN